MDEPNIRSQYQLHEKEFINTKDQIYETLQRIANAFYQKTKFNVSVIEPRIKSIESIVSKIKRKGKQADSLFKKEEGQISLVVNDFLGARICCNTREDVMEIAELIAQWPRFQVRKKQDFNKEVKESGYRALHLDVSYQTHWNDELVFIPVEIQIKTHLQSAWADITHDESYKPENEELKNIWEKEYSKHLADILDNLDNMASTIRKQRLSYVNPPPYVNDNLTIITSETLSYKISLLDKEKRLTQQEMIVAINRLKEEGFETIAEVWELLQDQDIQRVLKKYKEELNNSENVQPFEIIFYGSLIKRGNDSKCKEEMARDYGYVQDQCQECKRLLTAEEFTFIREKTDSDTIFYCADHRDGYFNKQCTKCGTLTVSELCKTCEAEEVEF